MESLAFTVTWVSTDLKLLLLAMGGPLQLKYKFPGFFFLNGATSCLFPRNEKRTHFPKWPEKVIFGGRGGRVGKGFKRLFCGSKADKLFNNLL